MQPLQRNSAFGAFLRNRIASEALGESVLDDAAGKHLIRMYLEEVHILMTEKSHEELLYHQGVAHGLQMALNKLREIAKQELTKQQDESDEE